MFLFHCCECSREIRVSEESRRPVECPDCGETAFVFARLARPVRLAVPTAKCLEEEQEPVVVE